MTTIEFEKDFKIKHKFVDIKEFYTYIIDNQFITEVGELWTHELTEDMKKKYISAKNIPDSDFVDLK